MITKNEFFDSMTGYIRMVEFHKRYVEFELPLDFPTIDTTKALVYFENNDVSIRYGSEKYFTLSGRIKDNEVFKYILKRYYDHGPSFNEG